MTLVKIICSALSTSSQSLAFNSSFALPLPTSVNELLIILNPYSHKITPFIPCFRNLSILTLKSLSSFPSSHFPSTLSQKGMQRYFLFLFCQAFLNLFLKKIQRLSKSGFAVPSAFLQKRMQMYITLCIYPSVFSKRNKHFSPLPVLTTAASC